MAEEPIPNTSLVSSEYFTADDTNIRRIILDDPSAFASSSDLSSSSEFYSARIEKMREDMRKLDVNNVEAKVEAEIEASKVHWSELTSNYCRAMEGPTMKLSTSELESECKSDAEELAEKNLEVWKDNLEVFRNLQEQYPGGFFFDGDYGSQPEWWHAWGKPKFILSEKPFAEGGQGQLFHAHILRPDGTKEDLFVMKVFKEGISLRDLRRQLPPAMLTDESMRTHGAFDIGNYCNLIGGAQLLKSSRRFAFIMPIFWGDLRKLIDLRMLCNNQAPPFPNVVAARFMFQIAKGMQCLHTRGIIHRDLKAANVLYANLNANVPNMESIICGKECLDPIPDIDLDNLHCVVADYECSVGVVGTRFWRAPEILLGIKNQELKLELFTMPSDVYSFGMTCYEILSGHIPFDGLRTNDYDGVIGGTRPELPSQSAPWMKDLVVRCWHKDPCKRPTFDEIVEIILEHYYAEAIGVIK